MHMQHCDITYDITAPFKDVMSATKMTRFGRAASKAHPPQNCLKQPWTDKSTAAKAHPERQVCGAMPHIYIAFYNWYNCKHFTTGTKVRIYKFTHCIFLLQNRRDVKEYICIMSYALFTLTELPNGGLTSIHTLSLPPLLL